MKRRVTEEETETLGTFEKNSSFVVLVQKKAIIVDSVLRRFIDIREWWRRDPALPLIPTKKGVMIDGQVAPAFIMMMVKGLDKATPEWIASARAELDRIAANVA